MAPMAAQAMPGQGHRNAHRPGLCSRLPLWKQQAANVGQKGEGLGLTGTPAGSGGEAGKHSVFSGLESVPR